MNNGNNNGNTMDDKLGTIKERVRHVVDQGQEKVGNLKTRVIEVKDQARTRGNAFVDRATMFIRANPLKSVGIAFGVGYLGMRLLRR